MRRASPVRAVEERERERWGTGYTIVYLSASWALGKGQSQTRQATDDGRFSSRRGSGDGHRRDRMLEKPAQRTVWPPCGMMVEASKKKKLARPACQQTSASYYMQLY